MSVSPAAFLVRGWRKLPETGRFRQPFCQVAARASREALIATIAAAVCLAGISVNADARVLESYSDLAERAIPGVVNIRTKTYKLKQDASVDLYQFFLKGDLPRATTTYSRGSGVLVDVHGHILTNYHLLEDADSIEILFADNKVKSSAVIIGTDPKTDLAVLKVSGPIPVRPLDLGNSDKLRVGDIVIAIGNPFGYAHTVTTGIISAKGRVIGTGPYDNFLQTDASIHPGNSGGPLIDVRGRVIGINTAVSKEGHGIGFAIPINLARDIMRDLLRHGKVIRPWLGVIGQNVLSRDDVDDSVDPSGVYGVVVTNLIIDAPAHKAGVEIGDLIMGLGTEKVWDMNSLQRLLGGKEPHDRLRLKVYRRGKGEILLTVELAEIPSTENLPQEKDLF